MSVISKSRFPVQRLRADLAGEVIAPYDAGYDHARTVFFPNFDRRPAVIVRPVDADEVALVVSLARESGLELAVRGGGHSVAGHGVSEGGVVVDLAAMKTLELDVGNRVAWAQAGLTAAEVTTAAGAYGLAVPFGDAGSVGIGGLTLGGGVGYLVRKHGLTIDSLLGAELVTADGSVRRIDADHEPDLFWAIRGGGGNFGVATRFQYRLHPVDTVFGGMLVLPATPETVAGFVAAAEAAPDELSTIANIMPAPPAPFIPADQHGKLVVLANVVHAGPIESADAVLAPFRALATPIADLLRPLPYPELFPAADGAERLAGVGRTLFLDRVDLGVAESILDQLRASSAPTSVVQLRVLGGAVPRVRPDATAFAHRTSRIMGNVAALYRKLEEASVHRQWALRAATALRQTDHGAYVNFLADEGEERIRAAYPGSTWNRLRAVKRTYDPENVFRLNQNIPPARGPASRE